MFKICEIDKNLAINTVQRLHYSKIIPRITKHYLGCYDDDYMFGVILLGYGTQPLNTIKKILYNDDVITSDYIEIGKMCFEETYNKTNSGSKIISCLVDWLRKNTSYKFLYTLADGIEGKCGYVYQASNFIYLGKFRTNVYVDTKTGEKIHPRSAKKLCDENALYEKKKKVYWLTFDFCKYKGIDQISGFMFRYIYPLNKTARKTLLKYDEYIKNKNPKEDDIVFMKRVCDGKFEKIEKPHFNKNCFNYNYQKY